MDDLRKMAMFYHVVEAGGYSAAARKINVAKSVLSKQITELERQLDVRLLNRTTRQLSLTEAGESYFNSCARIVEEAEAARHRINTLQHQISGTLRISCPIALGSQYLVPLISQFTKQYPNINIDLVVSDEIINMVEAGVDIAIRVGWLEDSTLIARKLTCSSRILCASPELLKQYKKPEKPEQLLKLPWIIFSLLPTPFLQTMTKQKQTHTLNLQGRIKTNNVMTLRSFLLEGMGIGVISKFLVSEDLQAGRLVQLFSDFDYGDAGIYAVYPDKKYPLNKTKVFLEFLSQALKNL